MPLAKQQDTTFAIHASDKTKAAFASVQKNIEGTVSAEAKWIQVSKRATQEQRNTTAAIRRRGRAERQVAKGIRQRQAASEAATIATNRRAAATAKLARRSNLLATKERLASKSTKDLSKSLRLVRSEMDGMALTAVAVGLALVTKQVISSINTYQGLSNKLKLVTTDAENLVSVQAQLFDVAQSSRGSLEATNDLYFRLAKSTTKLNLSQERLVAVTETVNKAVAVSGTTQQAASAALFQMGQGLAANALRGQELNSVMEQIPRVAQAIADGLGVDIGQLRDMAKAGKITAKEVIAAFESQATIIDAEFNKTSKTIDQAFTGIENAALRAFGTLDATDLTASLDDFRDVLADPAMVDGLQAVAGGLIAIATAGTQAAGVFGQIGQGLGIAFGKIAAGDIDQVKAKIKETGFEIAKLKTLIAKDSARGRLGKWLFGDKGAIQKELAAAELKLAGLKSLLTLPPPAAVIAPSITPETEDPTVDLKAQKELENLRVSTAARLDVVRSGLLSERDAEVQSFLSKQLILDENRELELISQQTFATMTEQVAAAHEANLTKITLDEAEKRAKGAKKLAKFEVKLKEDVASQSIGILRLLGGKSKAFAIAAIAIESIIGAKRIFISSQIAAAAALTPPPIGLGPVAGAPLAASIATMGKISAGLTLATGALQIGSLSSGGNSGSPVFQTDQDTGTTIQTGPVRVINMDVSGIFSPDSVVDLMAKLNEQVGDGVTLNATAVIA